METRSQFRSGGAAAGVKAVKPVASVPLEGALGAPLRYVQDRTRPPLARIDATHFSMNTGTGGRADPNLANWTIWRGQVNRGHSCHSYPRGGPKMDQFARGPRRAGGPSERRVPKFDALQLQRVRHDFSLIITSLIIFFFASSGQASPSFRCTCVCLFIVSIVQTHPPR